MDMREFISNRSKIPSTELEKNAGKYVAYSPDGKRILVAADDPSQLTAMLQSLGYDPEECVLSSIPEGDELVLGGGLDG